MLSIGKNLHQNNYKSYNKVFCHSSNGRHLGSPGRSDLLRNRYNRVLGYIYHSFSNWTAKFSLKLYVALIRSHLDSEDQF